jgi:membrane-bound lytic murein transglycosylase D
LLVPADVAEIFKQNVSLLSPEQRLSATIYTVKKGDSVASVAKKFGTRIDVIRQLNDLPSGPLTVGLDLRVPAAGVTLPPKVMLAAARVDGKRDRSLRGRRHVHIVRRGDSLWSIARRSGVDVNTLAMMNGMQPGDTLRAGQRLQLTKAKSSSSAASPSRKATLASTQALGVRPVTYTVRKGDTLTAIARLFQVTVAQIINWNDLGPQKYLKPGQKLTIRVSSSRG